MSLFLDDIFVSKHSNFTLFFVCVSFFQYLTLLASGSAHALRSAALSESVSLRLGLVKVWFVFFLVVQFKLTQLL